VTAFDVREPETQQSLFYMHGEEEEEEQKKEEEEEEEAPEHCG